MIIIAVYLFPNLSGLLELTRYNAIKLFSNGPSVPFENQDKPAIRGQLPVGEWRYANVSSQNQLLFRSFVYSSPKLAVKALSQLDQQTVVSFNNAPCSQNRPQYDPHNSTYSCAINYHNSYILALNPNQISNSPAGRFLMLHEVGHLVDFKLFSGQGYDYFYNAFASSNNFENCFHYESGCVSKQEIFADQFSYYATGYRENFTFYRTPQLLTDYQFEKILRTKVNG